MAKGMVVTARVVGAERVVARFTNEIPAEAYERVGEAVKELGLLLERKVKLEKLEGQVLHRRSGRLVRSINTRFLTPRTGVFLSSTGTSLSYGRAWELGFHGIVQVRGFARRIRSGDIRGQIARLTKTGRLVTRRGKTIAQGVSYVRPHTRRMNMDPRPFLRPALDEMRPTIKARLEDAVKGL